MTALEVATQDATYRWGLERGQEAFARECALPGRTYDEVSPADMREAVTRSLDALDPDVVAITSYSTPDAQAALRWCRRRRRGAVLMSASKADDAERAAWRERVKSTLVRSYDAALVGGTPQRRYLETLRFSPDRIFQPYNAVDNAFFALGATRARQDRPSGARRAGLPFEGPYFLCVSRFLALKNLDGLLRAHARYAASAHAERGPVWPLVLVGDGPQRAALERLVSEEKMTSVHFAGFQQKDILPTFYGLAGAFVLPTYGDTWGLVVNEAMAAGLPVLVSDRAGCHEDLVVDGRNGYTFSPDDMEELVRLMRHLSARGLDRAAMGQHSVLIVDRWSPEAFADGLWNAACMARSHADRPFQLGARVTLALLRLAARRHGAFHTVATT